MNSIFVCPKCDSQHTPNEYNNSRFCRECGKFLTSGTKRRISTSSKRGESASREFPLFPYNPYPEQSKFMKDIRKVVGGGGVLVAEACNGFGKTICSLATISTMNRKIIYATRTHEQVRQVLLEIENMNRSSEIKISAVNLASRQHLCLNKKCRNLYAREIIEVCRLLRENRECPYKTKIELSRLTPSVLSIEKLRRYGREKSICPYFLARKASENYTIIVAPYQYVFNEHVRKRTKLELKGRILILDEAHNADKIGQEALSDSLSERTLANATQELESIDASHEFIEILSSFLAEKVCDKPVAEQGARMYREMKSSLNVDNLGSVVARYSGLVDEIRNKKMEEGDYPICFLNGVLSFLNLVETSRREDYVAIFQRSLQGFKIAEYRCLDSSLALKSVIEESSGSLIMSGTLSPMVLFTEIMGLEEAETKIYSAIASPENIRTIVDISVTTRFKERTQKMSERYGRRLQRIIEKIPKGVLVFFPQRTLMLKSLKFWKSFEIMKQNGDHALLGGKPVFVEGFSAIENRKIVEEYKQKAKSNMGAVLCGVFRGRNAEGSNFPYDEARGVILIGVPYANYSDPFVRAQIEYLNKKRTDMGERWYLMDAFRAANQAMGRGIRHRDDWCNFILMDKRYVKHQELISPWTLSNGIQINK